ncbi:MAG: sulfur carrier protein ThiS [Hydrotalea flava]|uniref:sulfur carrier protein ThiS n=1 Tax=Hydrotalea TaxID=1004300 RepID=UPI000834F01E|nr:MULTISPECIES: sulfur carrier protein ThiS [Hydrotalea]RTL49273.1 MAG: sulfur carrier protein ThiS [Sphingobacteriales bacterium]MBY0347981.1 sulfur carrier protein ThiS [Hydrotalea flava]NIM35738.1 sulfur carrier protein ThiS [Hydrotalea flava]NIM38588.1 sulfur carrier protein ThiS [Hydrotalea flava]NIN03772.1 sulfur carrier protein ThiS [Hydrotalea flava]
MTIHLNEAQIELSEGQTITALLDKLAITSYNGIAVAVNNTVIQKKDWDEYQLQPNDKLVLIRASQGG